MERVLYLTNHDPWGIGGGCMASGIYLNAFCEIFKDYIIDLCISDDIPFDSYKLFLGKYPNVNLQLISPRSFFSKLLSPLTGITHRYQHRALELIKKNKYKYCIFDHNSIGGSLIKKIPSDTISIVIHHNYEPDYFKDNTSNLLMRYMLLPAVISNEKRSYRNSSINIFLTEEDLAQYDDKYGTTKSTNIIGGLFETSDKTIVKPVSNLNLKNPTIVITGSLNNTQNVDGIVYFFKDLYDQIPKDYKIIIAGKKPTEVILSLIKNKKNVTLIPNPSKMDEIISLGNIYLCPTRLGSGIKVRITDGLRNGLPILAHEVSARGYKDFVKKGYCKVFSSPAEFQLSLKNLVKEIAENSIKSEEITRLYASSFSFSNKVIVIKNAIENASKSYQ